MDTILLVLLSAGVVLLAIYYLGNQRRGRGQALQGRKAAAMSLYNRLGSDVATLDASDDPYARQALADAAERYNSAGSLFAEADTEGEIAAARRTAIEGLMATRSARERLGLPLGPELPPLDYAYGQPQLTAPKEVSVGDMLVKGFPEYRPGARYRYGGGGGIPGGWYPTPFWEGSAGSSGDERSDSGAPDR
ncbi:MAG: hypothetical protein M3443_03295 [Actinomycetota bacterium]|nr:hypothetical protein [Actinomycetota bacterium]